MKYFSRILFSLNFFTINFVYAFHEKTPPSMDIQNKSWDKRVYINGTYALSGLLSAELEFGSAGKWTNSIGVFYIHQDLIFLDYRLTGLSYRWNYYTAPSTYQDSWVFGVGFSIAHAETSFLFIEEDSYGIVPELNVGYKWNLHPLTLLLGAGFGIANAGLILNLGYNF